MPFEPRPVTAPGIERDYLAATGPNGTSPQNVTLTLPGYGVYLAVVKGRTNNANQTGLALAVISWWRNDPSGGSAALLANTQILGSAVFAGSPSTINALTVSAPSSTGVVTIGVGWSDGGSKTPWASLELRRLFTADDLAVYP